MNILCINYVFYVCQKKFEFILELSNYYFNYKTTTTIT